MRKFQIIVTGVPTDPEDIDDSPVGLHYIYAEDEELALDEFHWTIPISCLDDFDIEVEELP